MLIDELEPYCKIKSWRSRIRIAAFTCPKQEFRFHPDFTITAWQVDDRVVGIMANPARSKLRTWVSAFPKATMFKVDAMQQQEIHSAMASQLRVHPGMTSDERMASIALERATQTMKAAMKSTKQTEKSLTKECFEAYAQWLRSI